MHRQIAMCGALTALLAGSAVAAPGPAYEQAEIAGLQAATVAPEAAIRTAESKAQGRAVSFGLERTATVNAYEITIALQGGLQTVQIDPNTGAVIGVASGGPNSLAADGLPAQAVGRATQAPITLGRAVQKAEQQAHGRALEAGYAVHDDELAIDVDVIRDGITHGVAVDPQSGQIAKDMAGGAEEQQNSAENDGED